MNKVKMIVTDLDGTLLDKKRRITENAKKYLKKLQEEGYIITLASGRVIAMAKEATDGAEFADYIIFSHGSGVYDLNNDNFLYKNIIKEEIAREIVSLEDDDIKYIQFSTPFYHNRLYINNCEQEDEYLVKMYKSIKEFVDSCKDVTYMSIVLKDRTKSDEFVRKLKEKLKDEEEIEVVCLYDSYDINSKWIEILKKNTSKFNGIEKIAEYEKINISEIMAFGDADNDIDMIKKSGIGVAIGNAVDEVKKSAKYIAPNHDDDGVIKFLNEYLDNKK